MLEGPLGRRADFGQESPKRSAGSCNGVERRGLASFCDQIDDSGLISGGRFTF
jgi:hypothetical protein